MPRVLSLYFARRFIAAAVPFFVVILLLIYTADLIELLRRGAESANATAGRLAFLALLRAPFVAEETLPFVALFSAMACLIVLSRRLELVSARAAGLSAWQFMSPIVLSAAVFGFLATTLFNPLSTTLKRRADALESAWLSGAASQRNSLWLRQGGVDGPAIIHALGRGAGESDLTGVEVYEFSLKGEFETRIDAAAMRLEPKRWRLTNVEISSPNAPTTHADTYFLATDLTPDQVGQALASPDTVAFWSLVPTATLAERAGVDPVPYRLRFQELLARPLLLAAMALLAGCFSLRFFRSGGIGLMLSGGAASGFVLYIISKLSSEFGGAGLLGPLAAGWSPAILACVVSGTALLYLEDG